MAIDIKLSNRAEDPEDGEIDENSWSEGWMR
jgi:hypothetical protein